MDTETKAVRDGAGRPSEGALYAALAYTDRHIKGSDSLGDQIALKAARYAVQKLILAAPSAAGGGESGAVLERAAAIADAEALRFKEQIRENNAYRHKFGVGFGGSANVRCEAAQYAAERIAMNIRRLAPSPSQGSDAREAGREPGAYGIPGMPDRLSNSDQLRIFSAYYADRLPGAACAELVTMADEWDEEVEAAQSPADLSASSTQRGNVSTATANDDMIPTAPQGADLAGLSDPIIVHANMLHGTIAKPSIANIIHLYGREALLAALVPTTSAPPAPADREGYAKAINDRWDALVGPALDNAAVMQMPGAWRAELCAQFADAIRALAHPGSVAPKTLDLIRQARQAASAERALYGASKDAGDLYDELGDALGDASRVVAPTSGDEDWRAGVAAMRAVAVGQLNLVAETIETNARGGLGGMFASQSASDLRQQARRISELPVSPLASQTEGERP